MQPHQDESGRGPSWIAPLSVAVIWGVNVPVMKGALGSIDPFAFNALRLTASALVLGVVDRLERSGQPAPPTPWRVVIPLGLLTSLVYQVLFVSGIARTSATHTGFLVASGPLWTAVFAVLFGLERLGRRAWLGLSIAFFGTCLVSVARVEGVDGERAATLLGNGLLLGGMWTWSLSSVLARPVLRSLSATRLAFLATLISIPGHLLLAALEARGSGGGFSLDLGFLGWTAVIYSGALSTGIAYALWNRSLVRIGPARTSGFTYLVPIVALALAWAALGERPTPLQALGGALVLVGVAAMRRAKQAPPPISRVA